MAFLTQPSGLLPPVPDALADTPDTLFFPSPPGEEKFTPQADTDMGVFEAALRSGTAFVNPILEITEGQRRAGIMEGFFVGMEKIGIPLLFDPGVRDTVLGRPGASLAGIGPKVNRHYDGVTPQLGTIFAHFIEEFAEADSDEDVIAIQNGILRDLEAQNVMSEQGLWAFPMLMAAGIVSPDMLAMNLFLPGSGVMGSIAKAGGKHMLLKGAAAGAFGGIVAFTASEALLTSQQYTRTLPESMANAGASVLLGGLFGAGFTKLASRRLAKAVRDTEEFMVVHGNGADPKGTIHQPGSIDLKESTMRTDTMIGSDVPRNRSVRSAALEAIQAEGTKVHEGRGPLVKQPIETTPNWAGDAPEFLLNPKNPEAFGEGTLSGARMAKAAGFENIAVLSPNMRLANSPAGTTRVLAEHLSRSTFQSVDAKGVPRATPIAADQIAGKLMTQHKAELNAVMDANVMAYQVRVAGAKRLFKPKAGEDVVPPNLEMLNTQAESLRQYLRGFGHTHMSVRDRVRGKPLVSNLRDPDAPEVRRNPNELDPQTTTLTNQEFREAVTWAGDHADRMPGWPEIEATARAQRLVKDKFGQMALDLGLILEGDFQNVVGAKTYMTRVWNQSALRANRNEVLAFFKEEFRKQFTATSAERPATVTQVGTTVVAEKAAITDDRLSAMALHAYEAITGSPGRINYDSSPALQRRLISISNDVLNRRGYLERDSTVLMDHYLRTWAPDIAIMQSAIGKKAGATTVVEVLENGIEAVKTEYRQRMATATPKEVVRLENRMAKDVVMLRNLFDEVRHDFSNHKWATEQGTATSNALSILRSASAASKGGGFTISSLNDPVRIWKRNAAADMMEFAFKGFAKNPISWTKMTLQEMKDTLISVEAQQAIRSQALLELGTDSGQLNMTAKAFRNVSMASMYANALVPWNTFWKGVTGNVVTGKARKAALAMADGTATDHQMRFLLENNVELPRARAFAAMIRQHGDEVSDNWLSGVNAQLWDDNTGLAHHWSNMITREVDMTIVTPQAGDRPFAMASNAFVQSAAQFKTFGIVSIGQNLVPMGQRLAQHEFGVLNAFMLSIAGGLVIDTLKRLINGRDPFPEDRSLLDIAANAVDRSGELGMYADALNLGQKATGVGPFQFSRWQQNDFWQQLAGPALQQPFDVARAGGNVVANAFDPASDEWISDFHWNSMQRLAPFQNHFLLRAAVRNLGESKRRSGGRSPYTR